MLVRRTEFQSSRLLNYLYEVLGMRLHASSIILSARTLIIPPPTLPSPQIAKTNWIELKWCKEASPPFQRSTRPMVTERTRPHTQIHDIHWSLLAGVTFHVLQRQIVVDNSFEPRNILCTRSTKLQDFFFFFFVFQCQHYQWMHFSMSCRLSYFLQINWMISNTRTWPIVDSHDQSDRVVTFSIFCSSVENYFTIFFLPDDLFSLFQFSLR